MASLFQVRVASFISERADDAVRTFERGDEGQRLNDKKDNLLHSLVESLDDKDQVDALTELIAVQDEICRLASMVSYAVDMEDGADMAQMHGVDGFTALAVAQRAHPSRRWIDQVRGPEQEDTATDNR